MSVPTMRTPRSPFMRSARSRAAVPGAPAAVIRTVMSRIRSGDATELPGRDSGEELADAVPAGDLAAVGPAEPRPDDAAAEAAGDERLLRPAVDLRAHGVLRRRCKRVGERGESRAGGRWPGQGSARRRAAQSVRPDAG